MAEAIALVSGGLSFFEAKQNNELAKGARDQEITSENIAANQRRAITSKNLATVLGSVRAGAAGRGVAGSLSVFAESTSNIETAQTEKSNIEINRTLGIGQAQNRYASQYTNPLLAGITGYVGGGGQFGTNGAFGKDTKG